MDRREPDCNPRSDRRVELEIHPEFGARRMIPVLKAIAVSTVIVAASDGVPKIDVQPAGGIIGLKQDIQSCLQEEQNVRDQLVKEWAQFRAQDRAGCTRLATMSGGGT